MNETTTVTLREAAYAFGTDIKEITSAVDELSVVAAVKGKRRVRLLGMPDLMYFQALHEVGELLTPKGRLELHAAFLSIHEKHWVSFNKLKLPIEDIQHSVEKRLEALYRLKDQIEGDPTDPLIKGTSVEVYRVAALFDGGATLEEVKEDYPLLTDEQLTLAVEYSKVIPKKGRPYPKKSFKRALEGLNLDALDQIEDQG